MNKKQLRAEGHNLCQEIWDYNNPKERKAMYNWLEYNLPVGHFSRMNKDQLLYAIQKLKHQKKQLRKSYDWVLGRVNVATKS